MHLCNITLVYDHPSTLPEQKNATIWTLHHCAPLIEPCLTPRLQTVFTFCASGTYNKEQGNGLTMLTISATVLIDLCFTEYDRLGLSKADVMTTKSVQPRISTTSLIVPICSCGCYIKNGVVG